jgi:hypothetical protein
MVLVVQRGGGLLNRLINKLPFELHIPGGYRFCGPGTKLEKRLAKKEEGINPLDNYCKEHDIAYSQSRDLKSRHEADKVLADKAWSRVSAPDAKLSEKAAAYVVTNAMKAKLKLGAGMKSSKNDTDKKTNKKGRSKKVKKQLKQKKSLKDAILAARNVIKKNKSGDLKKLVPAALKAARKAVRGGKKSLIVKPRIIPIPKTGGALPFLIPLFAGLSAIGSLAGGAASVYKAINDVNRAKQENASEVKIHKGRGLYLKPYKQGRGIFLDPQGP